MSCATIKYTVLGCKLLFALLIVSSLVELLEARTHTEYYDILGVSPNASERAIRKAYHKLSAEWHPDKAQNEEERKIFHENMIKINKAFETLVDPEKRSRYDRYGEDMEGNSGYGGRAMSFEDLINQVSLFSFGGHGFGGHGFGGGAGQTCMQTTTCNNGICTVRTICQ
ncbi:chaperone protein DnaJ-like [Schistocerca gregaria]|uniref:chaperone protein DnaJ-like n=1 Tax=Schistocerca gregaria TaxID=7010 RepID=UPI00211E62C9|nr:chaperone protein DnaJ-like [Schistocerca gregaria]